MHTFSLTKTDSSLLEEISSEFEMDIVSVFALLQSKVLSILDSIDEGDSPDEVINRINELLG
jgi:hypothetical protein